MTRKIGLTGGIACGKTEAASRIQAHGIPFLDTDLVAHELMLPGTDVYHQVVDTFGTEILHPDGTIHRKVLGQQVFGDPEALSTLNGLVHPAVGQRWRDWLSARTEPVAIVAIPLLVETGVQHDFDDIVCVTSTEALMLKRLANRGLSPDEARQRIQSQLSLEEKKTYATWILENNGTLQDFHQQVDHWITTLNQLEM